MLATDRALDADVGFTTKRLADLRGNGHAAVHADCVEFPTEVVNGHVRLLAQCESHVLKSLDDASISKRVDLVRRIPELGQHLCGMFGE